MVLNAIVLRSRVHKEHDRIITCYTRELGKVDILVRSAQKSNSKLAPLTSGFYAILSLSLESGRNHYHLIGGEIKKYFKNILSSYDKTWLLARLFKTLDEIIKPEKINRQVFDLIVKFLESLNRRTLIDKEIFFYAFLLKFLSLLGYQPEIKKCLFCHRQPKAGEKIFFDVSHGGLVCEKCLVKKHAAAISISPAVAEVLRQLLYRRFDQLERSKFIKADFRRAKVVINRFFKWHLG
ncbi:MAG: DNA repair protein RecO [Patescibacteria group bacterium]|nr:DNA repair protein RecO [Patescibacteria group bacterium]MDD5121394.1 DNA repair protein RecO [Patescibacteria group bacterium]MDD5221880.1 DNA repair protein RecO [Patescibacteria group bacterium]MDD5395687.1 DNA repair protein RecO [Patescibacteria group bacterium]